MGFLGRRKEEGQDGGPLDMWGKPIRPRLDGWGRPIDDQGAAKGYADAFDGKISKLPADRRERRFAALAAAGCLIALAAFALAAFATCSVTGEDSQGAEEPRTGQAAPRGAEQAVAATHKLANADALAHLSEESRERLEQELSSYLDGQGAPSGAPAMCYSKIEQRGSEQVCWVSCPSGERFYEVAFDPAERTFSFSPCDMPQGLPEVNYAAVRSEEAAQPVYSSGAAVQSREQATVDGRSNVAAARVDDVEALKQAMPTDAAEALASAVAGFSKTKGLAADPSQCWVPLSASDGGAWEIQCSDGSGGSWTIEATWSESAKQFGMSLEG